jgi:hypothetical protein
MGFFDCCRVCKAPKRHPGCHSKCPEYIEQSKLWEQQKKAMRQEAQASQPAKTDWYNNPIWGKFKNY